LGSLLTSGSEKPGFRMDLIELRRFEFADGRLALLLESEAGGRGSISRAENDRFRDGERKEFGERDGRFCAGDG
jgi:hypothetical protein